MQFTARKGWTTVRVLVIVLALMEAGWMTFDGAHALTKGDYVTPISGPYAGELGPWSGVVAAVGIAPRSTLMKCIFVVYGIAWIVIVIAFAKRASWAAKAMLGAAAGSLWYLPIGTLFGVLQLVGLAWTRRKLY